LLLSPYEWTLELRYLYFTALYVLNQRADAARVGRKAGMDIRSHAFFSAFPEVRRRKDIATQQRFLEGCLTNLLIRSAILTDKFSDRLR
jgi:hypothetical protein